LRPLAARRSLRGLLLVEPNPVRKLTLHDLASLLWVEVDETFVLVSNVVLLVERPADLPHVHADVRQLRVDLEEVHKINVMSSGCGSSQGSIAPEC